MLRTYIAIAAVTLAFAPALAAAQSAVSDPAVPGSGYQVPQSPQTPRTSEHSLTDALPNPAVPGDGYKIKETPRTNPNPPAAEPGDGYQMRDGLHSDYERYEGH